MQPDLRAAWLPAVLLCAAPGAAMQSAAPRGHRRGGDGAETGATVKEQQWREIFTVSCFLREKKKPQGGSSFLLLQLKLIMLVS